MPKLVKIANSFVVEKVRRVLGQMMQDPEPMEAYDCIQPVIDVTALAGQFKTVVLYNSTAVAGSNVIVQSTWLNTPPNGKKWLIYVLSAWVLTIGTAIDLKAVTVALDSSDATQTSMPLFTANALSAVTDVQFGAVGGPLPIPVEIGPKTTVGFFCASVTGAPTVAIAALVLEVDST